MKNGLIEARFLLAPSRVEPFAAVLVEFMLPGSPSFSCVEAVRGIEMCASVIVHSVLIVAG